MKYERCELKCSCVCVMSEKCTEKVKNKTRAVFISPLRLIDKTPRRTGDVTQRWLIRILVRYGGRSSPTYQTDGQTDGSAITISRCALHCMLTAMKNIYIYTPIFKYTPPFFTRFKSFATLCKLRDPQLRVVRCPNPAPIFCALAFFSAV